MDHPDQFRPDDDDTGQWQAASDATGEVEQQPAIDAMGETEFAESDAGAESEYEDAVAQPCQPTPVDPMQAVLQNRQLLEEILAHLGSEPVADWYSEPVAVDEEAIDAVDENVSLRAENSELEQTVEELRREVEILTEQSNELASKVAKGDVVRSVSQSGGTSQTLSWEERKQQILNQMEDDSFDAESFISTLQSEQREVYQSEEVELTEDPLQYVHDLCDEIDRLTDTIHRYEEETAADETPQVVIEQPDERQLQQEAVAEAIAEAVDADEVVRVEREKLRQLQSEWEERFRATEIEVSLERAKLSRERLEMELKNEELEQEIAALKRQIETGEESSTSTRWMAKLGLTSGDDK